MPQQLTQVCQTIYEYASSTLATTTQNCYRSLDVVGSYGVDIVFVIIAILGTLAVLDYYSK